MSWGVSSTAAPAAIRPAPSGATLAAVGKVSVEAAPPSKKIEASVILGAMLKKLRSVTLPSPLSSKPSSPVATIENTRAVTHGAMIQLPEASP